MAQSVKKVTSKLSDIQSKAQEAVTSMKQKTASSTKATQEWSTTTPTVTETPKVASTAKAMPSVTKPEITPVSIKKTETPVVETPKVETPKAETPKTESVNIKDLLWSSSVKTISLKKATTPDLLDKTKQEELVSPVPWDVIASASNTWWAVKETVDKTILNQFTDWFNWITKKSEEDSQYYANKLGQSWVGGLWSAVVDLSLDVLDYSKDFLWYYSNKAIDTLAKSLWAQDTDITRERNKYWEEQFTPEQRENVTKTLKKLWIWSMNMINDTEYFIVKLQEVIDDSLWWKWYLVNPVLDTYLKATSWGKSYTESFQEKQWWFWDVYAEEHELESSKLYEESKEAQNVTKSVSDWLFDKTWNQDLSDNIWSVAWRVYANLKDPWQTAYTIWYMLPALATQYALWWWFRVWTALWTPSQSTSVYKDYSTDPELTSTYTDKELFGISTGIWVVLSMIEQFWDAVWDAPWGKAMSRSLRKMFSKSLKKELKEWLVKEITNNVDKNVIKQFRRPVINALKKWFMWWGWEALEEIAQETVQTEWAIALGSKRERMSLRDYITLWLTSWWMWWIIQWPWVIVNIKQNQDLKKEYDDFSLALDKIAPWIEEETKQAFFSAMITSQQNDIDLSEKKIERYETQVTKLYNEKSNLEEQEKTTTDETTKTNIKERITEIDNEIKEIDKKINQWNNTKEEIDNYIEEYNKERALKEELPSQKEIQLPKEEWWENLSEQTMVEPTENWWDKNAIRQSFEKSVQQIISWEKDYSETDFANNAYYNATSMVVDTKEMMDMVNKVEWLLNNIWVSIRYTTNPDEDMWWARWLYESDKKRVTYIKWDNDIPVYWHEVFHAMMDVIKNWTLTDKELQNKLRNILKNAINEVKKQFGIDIYKSWDELKYANMYAEEWLANAFWEYLAGREIAWPKTFVQKIKDFFREIIDLFTGNKLDRELRKAFETIASGKVIKWEWWFTSTSLAQYSRNPIESSTDITQENMAEEKGEEYINLVKENQTQSQQQEELWEHYENILEAGKESKKDNDILNTSNDTPTTESTSELQTTAQTVRDIFWKDKNKQIKSFSIMKSDVGQAWKDVMTPAISRIYNISPRVAWRLVQMETQRDINTYRYRERAKPFVEQVSKLDDKAKLEVKKALLDYWALAYEQWENIEQYKKDEVKKLKETLNKYWITNEMIDDTVWVLNELGQKYKDAWLSITLSDMYFPRTVTDYEWLSNYISEKTWIKWKDKDNLLNRIAKIKRNENLTDEEKEKQIRRLLTVDYKEPWTTSKHAKERKMWLLSEWGEWIYQFYADPMESLDNYIVNMENAIQRQLFLWWLQEEAWLKWENVSMTEIVEWLVDEWKISNEDLEELKKSVLSVLDKKPTPKVVSGLKNFTYVATLANFLSAINQLDDLAVVIIKNKSWLKNIVKTIAWKAWIKYNDLWLEDAYEMFRWTWRLTNWFFKASWFNTIDRLGKTAFINTAWDSLVRQAEKNADWSDTVARTNLKKRLEDMYWKETAEHIMEKIDSWDYMTNWQIDIDVLTDLLYQLWSTQPIYTSAMPTAYLNNPWVRLCYALQSFTIKRIDMLVQWFKEVYRNNWWWAKWFTMASSWLMWVSVFLSLFWVAIWDLQDWLKWEEEETVLWKIMNEWIDKALKEVWNEWKASWLKIWNLSLYDKKAYDREWIWWIIMNKVKPPMISIGKNFLDAITEHNMDEVTDLIQYIPLIWKILYYQFFDEMYKDTLRLNLDNFKLNLDDFELNLDDFELNI